MSGTRGEKNNGPLMVLLALLVGVGGWNFVQNTRVENAQPRPYRNYSDADLAPLIAAYQSQIDGRDQTLRAASQQKVGIRDGGLIGQRLDDFARVQEVGRKRRELAGRVSDSEHALEQVQLEIEKREEDRPIYKLILRRLITIRSF